MTETIEWDKIRKRPMQEAKSIEQFIDTMVGLQYYHPLYSEVKVSSYSILSSSDHCKDGYLEATVKVWYEYRNMCPDKVSPDTPFAGVETSSTEKCSDGSIIHNCRFYLEKLNT